VSPTKKKSTKRKTSRKTTGKKSPARRQVVSTDDRRSSNELQLLLSWFRLLARCRGAWLEYLWTHDRALDEKVTITSAEFSAALLDRDSPEAETEWAHEQDAVKSWYREAMQIKKALDELPDSQFQKLAIIFGIEPEELSLLQLTAAVSLDPSLRSVCAFLHDHSGRAFMTEELASRLLRRGRDHTWPAELRIFRWQLVHRRDAGVGEPTALFCDPQIRDWLVGRDSLNEHLIGAAKLLDGPRFSLPEWPVEEIASWVEEVMARPGRPRLRVVVVAPYGAGKREFAAAIANKLNMRMLVVDADAASEAQWPDFFTLAQRQAFIDSTVLAWTGETILRRSWPTNRSLFPLEFILCEPGSEPAPIEAAIDRRIELPVPEPATREKLWKLAVPEAARWPAAERHRLAEQHNVWPGDIERAGMLGAKTPAEASLVVRETARSRFGSLAQILECPFTLDDLVLSEGVMRLIESIIFEAEERVKFWSEGEARRLFPQGRGLVALFSGVSGTGKTMTAQVIAHRLTQDLCRVNVAQLVSKWVGETSKNAEQVIRTAANNNAVLFFDEADALFARRAAEIRDAQDKFANTDTAFLLQAIESYSGVAILATNLKSNIDPAFMRRLRYIVEFPKPSPDLQRQLWSKLVGALAGEVRAKALAPAIELLSQTSDATGAQIKFAVLAALFAARSDDKPLAARHLLMGLDRELGKEGRTIGPKQRELILKLEEAA
jgi:hypothetical protein